MMRNRILQALALCLAGLALAGAAFAAEPDKRINLLEPTIAYDGTILSIMVEVATPLDDISLLELDLLNPDLRDELEVQQAIAAGGTLTGVVVDVEIAAGDTPLSAPRVYVSGQGGRTMSKGFIYVLPPDTNREDLSVYITAEVWETIDGPVLERAEVKVPVPAPLDAETISIPADISLFEVLPNNMNLLLGEEAADRSWLGGVKISHSEEALCLMLNFDGDAQYEVACQTAADGEPLAYHFSLGNSWPPRPTEWAYYVYEPISEMPEKLILTLNHPTLSREIATIEVDLVNKTVTLV